MPYLKLKLLYLQMILQFIQQDNRYSKQSLQQATSRSWKYQGVGFLGNKLVLNAKKTKVMLVCSTRKMSTQHGNAIKLGGVQIEEVAETKLLGV
jgi:hypothetical protein